MQAKTPRSELHARQATRKARLPERMLLPLLVLLIISITTTFAREGMNTVYLSGQVVNTENGAPIKNQMVYIQSEVASSGGFSFYHIRYTDDNGFFYDTLTTTALKGSMLIHAYDVNGLKYELTEYFRFLWENEYYANVVLEVFDPGLVSDFQANFDHEIDTASGDQLSYNFTDESTGAGIVHWFWDFGDGNHSYERNPTHLYEQPGIYDVSLTISTENLSCDLLSSVVIKKVKVGMKGYYHLGGHAFAGYFPVDEGTAYLYKIEEDEFIPIDTVEFDTLGYYFFYQLIEGNYKVKTFPSSGSANAGEYLPTYFGNELLWTKAELINLTQTGWEYDISMIPNHNYASGTGIIDGQVSFDNKNPEVENIEVILFDGNDYCLAYMKSSKNGIFQFSELPFGTYKVLAEVPGMYTYPTIITLSQENPTIEGLNIVVYDEDIHYGIGDGPETLISGMGELYPNPARDHVNLAFNLKQEGNVQVFIIDQAGQVTANHSRHYPGGENLIRMNTSHLAAGIYRVMVLIGNEKHIKSFIKIN